jgi:chromosomal replication initiation ATPase DnaA
MRKPWFCIIDISEPEGRSVEEITREVARRRGIDIKAICSRNTFPEVICARMEAYAAIMRERPDLKSDAVAGFFNKNSSSVRHAWRRLRAA